MRLDQREEPSPRHYRVHLSEELLLTRLLLHRRVAKAGKGERFEHRTPFFLVPFGLPRADQRARFFRRSIAKLDRILQFKTRQLAERFLVANLLLQVDTRGFIWVAPGSIHAKYFRHAVSEKMGSSNDSGGEVCDQIHP